MTAKSMNHWNAHQLVVLDVETNGTQHYWHEIIQVAAIALDANLEPRHEIIPFDIYLSPENPERTDPDALRVTKLKLPDLIRNGHNPDKAAGMFEDWVKRLELGMTPSGIPKRIIPLAHNWSFDRPFFEDWLGMGYFNELIDSRARDTMGIANFLNDHAAFHAEVVPYSKCKLSWLASKMGIPHEYAHNALQDCLVTAQVYKALCQKGILG